MPNSLPDPGYSPDTPPPAAGDRRRRQDPDYRGPWRRAADRAAEKAGDAISGGLIGVPRVIAQLGVGGFVCLLLWAVLNWQMDASERHEAAQERREAMFLKELAEQRMMFAKEVDAVRERADKRAEMIATEQRVLAQESRVLGAELRRAVDALVQTNANVRKAIDDKDKPPPDGPRQ